MNKQAVVYPYDGVLLLPSHFSRVRPHKWQPTRIPRPWGSPGKNTGVGRHFLLQCMKVKSESDLEPIIQSEVSQKQKDKYRILTHIYRI